MSELSIYLTDVDRKRKIAAIQRVRAAQQQVGQASTPIREARLAVETVLETGEAYLIAVADHEENARQAIQVLEAGDYCKGSIGRPDGEAEKPEAPEDVDWGESIWQTSLILLAAAGGSPTGARHLATLLSKSTHDQDYFNDVIACYENIFPVMENPLSALLGGD